MHGAKIIPFRPLRKVTGEAVASPHGSQALPPRHWFAAYWWFWNEKLDRLNAYMTQLMEEDMGLPDLKIETPASEAVVIATRTFKAPRRLVWTVMTEAEHVARWWGVEGHRNEITDFDVRPGGKWRIVSHAPENDYIFVGEFREVLAPERFVWTFGMENLFFGKTLLETHSLDEVSGVTHYKSVSKFDTIEDRDGMVASGMEKGMLHGFAVMDDILAELLKA